MHPLVIWEQERYFGMLGFTGLMLWVPSDVVLNSCPKALFHVWKCICDCFLPNISLTSLVATSSSPLCATHCIDSGVKWMSYKNYPFSLPLSEPYYFFSNWLRHGGITACWYNSQAITSSLWPCSHALSMSLWQSVCLMLSAFQLRAWVQRTKDGYLSAVSQPAVFTCNPFPPSPFLVFWCHLA